MKFWLNGIHDEYIEGSVEIPDEEWQSIVDHAQEKHWPIVDGGGYPLVLPVCTPEESMAINAKVDRENRLRQIEWRRSRYYDEIALGLTPTEEIIPILQYIQALRDITKQPGFPTEIQWPEIPGEESLE